MTRRARSARRCAAAGSATCRSRRAPGCAPAAPPRRCSSPPMRPTSRPFLAARPAGLRSRRSASPRTFWCAMAASRAWSCACAARSRRSRPRASACGSAPAPPIAASRSPPCRPASPGLEFFIGIPGTLGGAVRMNAGAFGGETAAVVEEVTALDPQGRRHVLRPAELGFAYRHSGLPGDWIVIEAVLKGVPGDQAAIRARMAAIKAEREASQPLRVATGGSTFKNPRRREGLAADRRRRLPRPAPWPARWCPRSTATS